MSDVLYKVTGVFVNGKRFKPIITKNYSHAMGINLYRGTVWMKEDAHGEKWRIVKRVYN